mmetsp:Transcript_180/g.271  ORF Transcript_180/g.271 Transcript_180/m.271 type:complete len:219 (-) Transcript_180:35-691(-)
MAAILCQSISSLCSSLCSGCGQLCKLPCTMCSAVSKPLCEGIKTICTSHFCIYTTLALGLNIPPVIFGFESLAYSSTCKGSLWLGINILFCVAHIVAAFYLATKTTSWNETMQTLCYDPWIAAYILTCIASFVWLGIGMSWAVSGEMLNGNCPGNIQSLSNNSMYCGYAFFALGCSALFISMAISMCMGRRESNQQQQQQQQQNSTTGYVAFPVANKV